MSPWGGARPLKQTICVASGKLFNLSVPCEFPHLKYRMTATHTVIKVSGGLNEELVKQLGDCCPQEVSGAVIITTGWSGRPFVGSNTELLGFCEERGRKEWKPGDTVGADCR